MSHAARLVAANARTNAGYSEYFRVVLPGRLFSETLRKRASSWTVRAVVREESCCKMLLFFTHDCPPDECGVLSIQARKWLLTLQHLTSSLSSGIEAFGRKRAVRFE